MHGRTLNIYVYTPHLEITEQLAMPGQPEFFDPRYHPRDVPPFCERLHQETIGFIAAAMGWIVEGIMREQNSHLRPAPFAQAAREKRTLFRRKVARRCSGCQ